MIGQLDQRFDGKYARADITVPISQPRTPSARYSSQHKACPGKAAAGSPGAKLFADNCTSCHGDAGEGTCAGEQVGVVRIEVALRLAEMAEQVVPAATEPQPSRPSVRLSLPPEAAPAAPEPPAQAAAPGEDPSPSEPGAAPTTKLRAVTKEAALAEAAKEASAPALQGNETRKTPAVLSVAASRPVPSLQETGPWQAFSEIDRRVLITAAAGVLGLASIVIEYDMCIGDEFPSSERDGASVRYERIEPRRWIVLIRTNLEYSLIKGCLIER